jgi:hypothetical protein
VTLAGVTEERRFSDISLMVLHPANEPVGNRKVKPDKVDVFLEASPQLLDDLEASSIRAFVSTEGETNKEREVRVLVPPGIDVLGVRPDTVLVLPEPTPAPEPTPTPAESTP